MTAQRVQLHPAYVLHRRPYRETSWLLEVFTREHGRLGLIARAARQPRPRATGSLEPMRELLLSWTLRGELGLVSQSEAVGTAPGLAGERLLAALYLNELLLRLTTRHDPHPGLFDCYRDALRALTKAEDTGIVLRRFEKHLLQELGYGLNLGRDSAGELIDSASRYDYRIGEGACPLRGEAHGVALSGELLLALRDDRLDAAQSRREIRQLLQAALSAHLGEKPLRTPELFRSLRRLGTANPVTPPTGP